MKKWDKNEKIWQKSLKQARWSDKNNISVCKIGGVKFLNYRPASGASEQSELA
jgi:hypothetical protein